MDLTIDFDKNGRKVLLGGERGHLAAFNWQTSKLDFEINVMERINCVKYLDNDLRLAVAQKEWTYIYDNQGTEGHCLKMLDRVVSMDYLPHHYLLVTGNKSSWLQHLDISTGTIVSKYCVRKGPLYQMCHWDGVTCLGHTNGSVTFWKPYEKPKVYNIQEYSDKTMDPGLLGTKVCNPIHEGAPAITSMCVSHCGNYLATAAANRKVWVFDLRYMGRQHVYKYHMNFSCKNMQNKLPYDTISFDPDQLNKVDMATIEQKREDKIRRLGYVPTKPKFVPRKKMKGKGKSGAIEKR